MPTNLLVKKERIDGRCSLKILFTGLDLYPILICQRSKLLDDKVIANLHQATSITFMLGEFETEKQEVDDNKSRNVFKIDRR